MVVPGTYWKYLEQNKFRQYELRPQIGRADCDRLFDQTDFRVMTLTFVVGTLLNCSRSCR